MQSKAIKVPSGERVWISFNSTNSETKFFITSKATRDFYYLYEVLADGSNKKLGKAKSPKELEEKFDILSKL